MKVLRMRSSGSKVGNDLKPDESSSSLDLVKIVGVLEWFRLCVKEVAHKDEA